MADTFQINSLDTSGDANVDITISGTIYNQDIRGVRVDTGVHTLADITNYCTNYRTSLLPATPPSLPADVAALLAQPESF